MWKLGCEEKLGPRFLEALMAGISKVKLMKKVKFKSEQLGRKIIENKSKELKTS